MELGAARRMAQTLMRENGLHGWTLVLDGARTRAGVCRPATRQIGLSRVLTPLHDESEVRDTVLHEIAHALVGASHGHDAVWRAKARELGCSPQRCLPATAARVPGAWQGACPAGHTLTRHRRPSRVASCRACTPAFDPSALLTWTYRGRRVPMGSGYEAELALVTGRAARNGRTRRGGRGMDETGGFEDGELELGSAIAGMGARGSTAARVREAQQLLAQAYAVLPVGTQVTLGGRGRYAGLVGTIEKRARTRYHVRTPVGLVTAPFALVSRA